MSDLAHRVRQTIRDVPDFPKEGILFKDITPVLQDGALFAEITAHLAERYRDVGVTAIAGVESRGFILGAPLANALGLPFVLVRKPGKLPSDSIGVDYELEYGTDRLEVHSDALDGDDVVVVVDDLLATGGTASATVSLLEKLGASVHECAFIIELSFLEGSSKLGASHYAMLSY